MECFLNILSTFDTRTSTLLIAIAFFIQANAIGAQAFLIREYKGVRTALLGNLSLAIGFALLLFRNILPDFLTIVVANTLNILSPGLYYIAISKFIGQRYNKALVISTIAIAAILLIYFRFAADNIGIRIIIISLSGALLTFATVYKLWKARHAPFRFGLWLATIPIAIYGIMLVTRTVSAIISPPEVFMANTPIESANRLLLFVISFLWSIGFILMVSQRLQVDLTELATIDKLTHIPNRRATQTFFEKAYSHSQRTKSEFAILLIDLDNFKNVNDKHGHEMGDFVLIKAARLFHSAIRNEDIVGRWGGEEFLIVSPDTTIENAEIFAERLRNEVSAAEFKDSNASLKITISIGVASSKSSDAMDVMLKKADNALYKAKVTRDSIVVAK